MAREHAEDASPTLPLRMPREEHAGQRIPGRRHARGVQRSVLAASTGARSISTDRALGRQSTKNETVFIASCAATVRPIAPLPAAAHLQGSWVRALGQ